MVKSLFPLFHSKNTKVRNGLWVKKSHNPRFFWVWLMLGVGSFALIGCNTQRGTVNGAEDPLNQAAPHLAQVLPPEWTATPEARLSLNDQAEIQVEPTVDLGHLTQEPVIIGYSVEQRALEVYRFGYGPRNLMIVAGIHGGYEWNTISLAEELIAYLDENPDQIPEDVTLHILRSLNPDGGTRGGSVFGRGNANGVDLNRNWNVLWQEELPEGGCWDLIPLTGGPNAASEPETNALMGYILEIDSKALISYHSAGLGIFAGGRPSTNGSLSLAEAIASVSDYPYPAIDIGCEYTGTLIDWTARRGIPSVDIELSTHWGTDFEQNLRILDVFLEWRP
jgi:hypothetical protein